MKITRVCLLLICPVLLMSARQAHGDVLPDSLLKDRRLPAMRFDNLAEYPQFDFFLKYAVGRGNPYASPHVTPVHSGQTLQPEGHGRIGEAYLLAVPHGQQPPAVPDVYSWAQTPTGCLQSAPLKGVYEEEGSLVSYRVRIEDNKLEVSMQAVERQPLDESRLWRQRLPWIVASLAVCVALSWLSLRLARRLFPSKPHPVSGS